ncbi:pitrilysin family protein [Shewanella sp. 6_MG-2023]|uniref:M16 family metallopeptidase n=1 Tax=Shewanella sp. 6_MG-2023 TaxID=3062660 RepID=UPI0026E26D23|nr:pitrilysin family protein [Shewanella sp. 6_MG-2023]MDO6618433.1 pitrilysin family protein [Shewanella sp. 6_MG-2023]
MMSLIKLKKTSALTVSAIALACGVGLAGCKATTESSKPLDTGSFSMPQYQSITLKNGLLVNLMVQQEVPIINFNAVVRAGAVNDTTSGVSYMTMKSLLLGAGGKSKAEIEQMVDFLGASLSTASGRESMMLEADFMSKDLDTMLDIIQPVLISPDFDHSEFEKLRQREIVGLSQAKESPRAVIGRYYNKLVFGEHPYANPISGNSKSLADINVTQLRAFHQSYFQPKNTAINVVGDFDIATMKAKLSTAFGGWKNTDTAVQPDLTQGLAPLTASKVLLVDKPDAIETTFVIGGLGIKRDNPDYVGLTVVNTILGGRFTSWLNDELRVNAGLTYGARSGFSAYSAAGVFSISTFTKTSTTKEAMDLALKTYGRLWEQGIDQQTLDSAKAYVKGQYPPKFETGGQLGELLADMYIYNFDDAFINEFQAKVDGLTLAETQRLINRYFPKDNLQYVLVGNAAQIADIAKEYGEVTKVNITDVGFGQ